jgi:hypothetical protein
MHEGPSFFQALEAAGWATDQVSIRTGNTKFQLQ